VFVRDGDDALDMWIVRYNEGRALGGTSVIDTQFLRFEFRARLDLH